MILKPPPAQTMVQALELLYALGGKEQCRQNGRKVKREAVLASIYKLRFPCNWMLSLNKMCVCVLAGLDHYGRLTDPMGVRMAEFPLSPMFAKMLLESGNFGCSKEIATIAAMMQIQNVFVVPPNQKKAAVSENRLSKGACLLYLAKMLCQRNN